MLSKITLNVPNVNEASAKDDGFSIDMEGNEESEENRDWDEDKGGEVEDEADGRSERQVKDKGEASGEDSSQTSDAPSSTEGKHKAQSPAASNLNRFHLTITEAKSIEALPDSVLDTIDEDFGPNQDEYHFQALVSEHECARLMLKSRRTRTRLGTERHVKTATTAKAARVTVVHEKRKTIKFVWRDAETRTSDRLAAQAAAAAAARTAPAPVLGVERLLKGTRRAAALNMSDVVSYTHVFNSQAGILTSIARHTAVLPLTKANGEKWALVGTTSGRRAKPAAQASNIPPTPTLLEMRLALDLDRLLRIAGMGKSSEGEGGDLELEDGNGTQRLPVPMNERHSEHVHDHTHDHAHEHLRNNAPSLNAVAGSVSGDEMDIDWDHTGSRDAEEVDSAFEHALVHYWNEASESSNRR